MNNHEISKTLEQIQQTILPQISNKVIANFLHSYNFKEDDIEKIWQPKFYKILAETYKQSLDCILAVCGLLQEGYHSDIQCSQDLGTFIVKIWKSKNSLIIH